MRLSLRSNPALANWFYGFKPPEHGAIVLGHRRVYIVPSRLGWLFAGTLGILLVGSINYALSLGFGLAFLLAGVGLAGMVHTTRNLVRLSVRAARCEPVFAGDAAQFRLTCPTARNTTGPKSSCARSIRARSAPSTSAPRH